MAKGFAKIPRDQRFVLANATLPAVLVDGAPGTPDGDGLIAADITIRDGNIERIDKAGRRTTPAQGRSRPRHGVAVLRRHAHPPRQGPHLAAEGEPGRHLRRRARRRRPRPAAELEGGRRRARMDFGLRAAPTPTAPRLSAPTSIRPPPQHQISWPVFAEMRERWRARSTCRRCRSSASTRSATRPTPTNWPTSLPSMAAPSAP